MAAARFSPPSLRSTLTPATFYRRDFPKAEVHIVDGGHFALDAAADDIAALVRDFMSKSEWTAPVAPLNPSFRPHGADSDSVATWDCPPFKNLGRAHAGMCATGRKK